MMVIKFSALVTSCLLLLAAGVQITYGPSRAAIPDPATCVEAVLVEPRKLQSIALALESAVNSKNAHFDQFTIAHGNQNAEYVRELVANSTILRRKRDEGTLIFRHLEVNDLGGDGHRLPAIKRCQECAGMMSTNLTKEDTETETEDDLQHHDEYSKVLKSRKFWEGFTCDRSLLMQSDTVLCANSNVHLSDFMEYEYVGAHTPRLDKWYPGDRMHLNGGLSYRNRKGMLRCIDEVPSLPEGQQKWLTKLPEDSFFSTCEQLKQPSKGQIKPFGIDCANTYMGPEFAPFGVHKPWGGRYPEYSESNLKHCEGARELMWHMKQ